MEREFLQLDYWDQLDAVSAEKVARTLGQLLPPPWKFHALAFHELGDQRRHVAFFDWNKKTFALIPGGKITLGYDRRHPFVPTEAQLRDWQATAEEYGWSLKSFFHRCLTPLRRVELAPFLLEVKAVEWDEILHSLPGIEKDDSQGVTLSRVVAVLARGGFRPPTSDEWEHACAAGSRTLFRWGDGCPTGCYPVDPPHRRRGASDWNPHRQPNAFGLQLPSTGYEMELTLAADSKEVIPRGGDGGSTTCGGAGFFAGWLCLASSFVASDLKGEWGQVRRVFPLPAECIE
jgi:hypothetical protein